MTTDHGHRRAFPAAVHLTGHGVVLREWTDRDLVAMVGLFDDPAVAYWTPLVSPFDLAAARAYLRRARRARAADERLHLAITTDGHEPRGEVLLSRWVGGEDEASIGYSVGAAHRGQGLAIRAVNVLAEFALTTLGLARVLLEIEPGNAASVAVARGAGFHLTDTPPVEEIEKGRPITLLTWARDH
ncbi:GNAT family N-acetyltransferase [Planotetraspora sp. A-T 1434]|uniref:GNAT family N-acetyltransferase n=1 Tax=Planotetraspora sp. A-T 1434 TaxID=2979219 RepID=UPI0021BE9844|nr:GNAT family N-acetyltransferase [Planotetraspora sp. A-T 1434]MCT9931894.1 GNAT family N-acetyltransferase [Planotetraspora sp. A-T 1434]